MPIEFKLGTLTGVVLLPFALWNKTAFLAEKACGDMPGLPAVFTNVNVSTGLFHAFDFLIPAIQPSLR